MTGWPKVSIVTPSYNQGQYLEKTIRSVLDQGYPNLEYIIIDGGSTDDSVDIIKRYEQHIAYWESVPDRGQSHAINKGFARATGDIYAWLNSDDWYAPGALQTVADTFVANPEAGAVVGAGEMVDEGGARLLFKSPTQVTTETLCRWLEDYFWQPSTFFRQQAWTTCGPLDEDVHYAMDLDLWLKISKKFAFVAVPAFLSSSLRHPEAKTTAKQYISSFEVIQVIVRNGGESILRNGMERYAEWLTEQEQGRLWQISECERHSAECEWQLAECERQRGDLARELSAMRNSLSWRITRPFRRMLDSLRRS